MLDELRLTHEIIVCAPRDGDARQKVPPDRPGTAGQDLPTGI
jgi:hypothetical protein